MIWPRLMLLCISLILASGCASPLPVAHISSAASGKLSSLQRFQLTLSDSDDQLSNAQQIQLQGLLIKAISQRGYVHTEPAEIQVHTWLSEHSVPLHIYVDTPAPEPLGPYLAVHQLQDVSATLRVQMRDNLQQLLWEGQIETPLSPSAQRNMLLEQALQTLFKQLPRAGD